MTWDKKPSNFINIVVGEHEERMKKAAFYILRQAVTQSPTDTGRFRGNWQVGNNQDIQSEVEQPWGEKGARAPKPSGGAVIAREQPKIQSIQDPFRTIYIINNVPYAARLNNSSHSSQVKPGWVNRIVYGAKTLLDKGLL